MSSNLGGDAMQSRKQGQATTRNDAYVTLVASCLDMHACTQTHTRAQTHIQNTATYVHTVTIL